MGPRLSGRCDVLSKIWHHTKQSLFDFAHADSDREEKTAGRLGWTGRDLE